MLPIENETLLLANWLAYSGCVFFRSFASPSSREHLSPLAASGSKFQAQVISFLIQVTHWWWRQVLPVRHSRTFWWVYGRNWWDHRECSCHTGLKGKNARLGLSVIRKKWVVTDFIIDKQWTRVIINCSQDAVSNECVILPKSWTRLGCS